MCIDDEGRFSMSTTTSPTTGGRQRPRRRSTRRAWRRILLGLVAVTALFLGACSDSDFEQTAEDAGGGDASDATAPPAGEPTAGGGEEGGAPGDDGGTGDEAAEGDSDGEAGAPTRQDGTAPVVLTETDLSRSIIYTATVELQADDVAGASREAQLSITALGGLVFGQETTSDPQPRSVLVFKVPPERFGEALEALDGLGEVVRQDVSADDVTERVVDLQSQIASAEVSVQRLRELLDEAPNLEAIAQLESQLLQRETTLEQLRGQLRTLQDQVALATITVTISQPEATPRLDVEVTAYVGRDAGARCPGDEELAVDDGEELTLCLSMENTGNVSLTEIEVRDHGLDLDPEDVTLVDFGTEDVLEPDDVVTAWAPITADADNPPAPDVSAVPLDEAGNQLRVGVQTETAPIELDVDDPATLPGFGDSFAAGWDTLQRAVGVAIVVVGALTPFLVVLVPAAAIWWWRRNREDEPATPPPPPVAPERA